MSNAAPPPRSLPADTRIGTVHLRVAGLERATAWYEEVLGCDVLAEDGVTSALGSRAGRPLLVLHGARDAPRAPPDAPGLFHVAFLLPSRLDLATSILRVRDGGWTFVGCADHNVSEAAYLDDPEGNGIELYADRPSEGWRTVDGRILITTEPLDLDGLLAVASGPAPLLPRETAVGHVHLRVTDLAAAEAFYAGRLGFGVTSRTLHDAVFLAAGSYHHHVGCNVWGRPAGPRPEGARGLISFEIVVPDDEAREMILDGAGEQGTLLDPDGLAVRVVRE